MKAKSIKHSGRMSSIKEQFKFQIISNHFETDTHNEVQNLDISNLRILSGEQQDEDILVVEYEGSPNLSFYDSKGKLLDVDHYLPDNFRVNDIINVDAIISNLKYNDIVSLKSISHFEGLLKETFALGKGNMADGIKQKFGFSINRESIKKLLPKLDSISVKKAQQYIINSYTTFHDLLSAIILHQQKIGNGYVHITPEDNIVITPLNKRSGVAVIIETKDAEDRLLPANKWNIVRTHSTISLEQTLTFRTKDVKNYFSDTAFVYTFETDRYKLYYDHDVLSIDSYLDNTDNLLKVNILNNCYKVMASDHNMLIALSHDKEITIINTHKSVVPHKWPKKIVLPIPIEWVRLDENLMLAFCQESNGMISCYDISLPHPEKITEFGKFEKRFELDQKGQLICRKPNSNKLIIIKTNIQELKLYTNQKNFNTVFNNISHLFKGESLFVKNQFAKPITEIGPEEENKLPTVIENARYDFETNVENLLANSDNTYEGLLDIKEKIAIARRNITEELMTQADKENVFLVGQRLKSTINNIMLPSEQRIRNLVEELRCKNIILTTRSFRAKSKSLEDPNDFRIILNRLRVFEGELSNMLSENTSEIIDEFKEIQTEVNSKFSEEIAKEGNVLQKFIANEILEIEDVINKTHPLKVLESILGTHPAAVELMVLLKQPFILQNIAKEKELSPAAIQKRLFKSVENRRLAILGEQESAAAEKNAAKLQLAKMIRESIDFFVDNHSEEFSDIMLSSNLNYQNIHTDISKLEKTYGDVRLAMDLRRVLNRKILEVNRTNLEKRISYEGKYAFIKNDPHLFVDLESVNQDFPHWHLDLTEKKGSPDRYLINFIKETDKEVYRPSTTDNLKSGKAFELNGNDYRAFFEQYDLYIKEEYPHDLLEALWAIYEGYKTEVNYPQFASTTISVLLPKDDIQRKALRCALEKKRRDELEKTRKRNVPKISPEFIDNTPYFKEKLYEFILKAKIQLTDGAGIVLLTGPPSTGKSAFLKYAASIMNREYFEHASDKWQSKNSLVTAIKFGEFGPYSVPAGFTKAITTPNSLINIEEIKEWPEALRKSLNPFFAGSKVFLSPDGTRYNIANNILLCAATNLGAIYRQDDEPFTADFWSRIEVVEYDYAPLLVTKKYYTDIFKPKNDKLLTVQDLARQYFKYEKAPKRSKDKAIYYSNQFLKFILLPKADEKIKRANITNYIDEYFNNCESEIGSSLRISPEEAIKISLKRIKDFQGFTASEFYDLYNHYINDASLRTSRFKVMKKNDTDVYEHLKVLILCIGHIERCLRSLREVFYNSAGQTEIEGTNREFIKCVHLLGLIGKT